MSKNMYYILAAVGAAAAYYYFIYRKKHAHLKMGVHLAGGTSKKARWRLAIGQAGRMATAAGLQATPGMTTLANIGRAGGLG
jgi:hypothetical protein